MISCLVGFMAVHRSEIADRSSVSPGVWMVVPGSFRISPPAQERAENEGSGFNIDQWALMVILYHLGFQFLGGYCARP